MVVDESPARSRFDRDNFFRVGLDAADAGLYDCGKGGSLDLLGGELEREDGAWPEALGSIVGR